MKLISSPGARPLWSQLCEALCTRIEDGTYPVGEAIPTEMELVQEFDVSRTTVRRAMERLVSMGYVARQRGKGTVVLERRDKIQTAMTSTFNGVQERHNDRKRRVVSVAMVTPPREVTSYFQTAPDQRLLQLERQTVINGHVAASFRTYLGPAVPIDAKADFSGSLYQRLSELGLPVDSITEKISAELATAEDVRSFACPGTTAIMCRVRMGKSGGQPVEYTYSRYLATDYELTIRLVQGQ